MRKRKEMASDFDKHAGSRIKHFRVLRGMTQTALAVELGGLTPQQLQKYEWGQNRLSMQTAFRLKTILKMEWDDFILSGSSKTLDDLAEESRNSKFTRVIKYFKKLDIRSQDIVLRLIKDLAQDSA